MSCFRSCDKLLGKRERKALWKDRCPYCVETFLPFVLPAGISSLKKGERLTTMDCCNWDEQHLGENTRGAARHHSGQV